MKEKTKRIIDSISDLMSLSSRAFYHLDRDEKICYGLTLTQCFVIQTVFADTKLNMRQLSGKMHLTTSTMTRVIANLVKSGYLKRESDENDRRIIYIALTEKGKKMALMLKNCEREYHRQLLSKVPEEKLPEIESSLKILNNAVKERRNSCCK